MRGEKGADPLQLRILSRPTDELEQTARRPIQIDLSDAVDRIGDAARRFVQIIERLMNRQ